jgi:glycerate 2-kinase
MKVLAAPTSLKGALSAVAAADALAEGLRAGGAEVDVCPVADGGDGTLDVLGGEPRVAEVSAPLGGTVHARWSLRGGTAVVESAQALGFHTVDRLDPLHAWSRGLGELILAATAEADALLIGLGGTVTIDGGAGMQEVLFELPLPTTVLCDVNSALLDAVYVFGPQKGLTDAARQAVLVERLRGLPDVPGAGAAGGLGGALAAMGATLVSGAPYVLDAVGFDASGYDVVVTGEGRVDATTGAGKAVAEVQLRCAAAGVRCETFSAADEFPSGIAGAAGDLHAYGERLARDFS